MNGCNCQVSPKGGSSIIYDKRSDLKVQQGVGDGKSPLLMFWRAVLIFWKNGLVSTYLDLADSLHKTCGGLKWDHEIWVWSSVGHAPLQQFDPVTKIIASEYIAYNSMRVNQRITRMYDWIFSYKSNGSSGERERSIFFCGHRYTLRHHLTSSYESVHRG